MLTKIAILHPVRILKNSRPLSTSSHNKVTVISSVLMPSRSVVVIGFQVSQITWW